MEEQVAGRTIKIGLIAVVVAAAAFAAVLVVPDITHAFAQQDHDVETDVNKVAPTINVDDPYLELLKQDDFYLNMTSDEQGAYVQMVNEIRANHAAYEREVWKLFDTASLLELEYQAAGRVGDQERMNLIDSETHALLKTLETYGVTTLEKVQKDPDYWESQATKARNQINGQTHVNTGCIFNPEQPCNNIGSVVPVHDDNVNIKNKAIIWYPALLIRLFPVPWMVSEIASGPSTVTAEVNIMVRGLTEFKAMACYQNDPHDTLQIHLSSTERLYRSTDNAPYYEKSNRGWKTVDPQNWFTPCIEWTHTNINYASSRATLESTVSSLITTGRHI